MAVPDDELETNTTTTQRVAGSEPVFGTDPDEIYIELRAGRPNYIHVAAGHSLQEGDASHRDQLGTASPTVRTWEVDEITPDRVVGRDIRRDERTEWDRETIEEGLAIGTYSTNLTDFACLSVHQVGSPDDESRASDAGRYCYTGPPYVSVVAYGDNGLKYGRRYRFVDGESMTLELWTQDDPVERLAEEVVERLDQRVREALEADGYTVVDAT